MFFFQDILKALRKENIMLKNAYLGRCIAIHAWHVQLLSVGPMHRGWSGSPSGSRCTLSHSENYSWYYFSVKTSNTQTLWIVPIRANWTHNFFSFSCYSICYMSCSLSVSECIANCSTSWSQSCSTCLAVKQCRELSASHVSVAAMLHSLKYLERNLELIITTPFWLV